MPLCADAKGAAVPDLGLWRPLGNNIIENSSTPWPNKFNDCKDMCGIIMLQLTMSPNVAATHWKSIVSEENYIEFILPDKARQLYPSHTGGAVPLRFLV